jgi:hypothetical protein
MSTGAGLPMITGTRIDSASKHQIACRIDFERMLSWVGYDHLILQREKLRFCMKENDLAVGCGPPIRNNEPQRTSTRNKAYPSIVVTLADIQPSALNYLIALYHNCLSMADRDKFVEDVERTVDRWVGGMGNVELAKKQIQEMPEFFMVGVSVGTAWAHIKGKQKIAYPKPFLHDDEHERIYDRRRVFAKALCSARPFEPVDIMICRQSL